MPLPRVGQRPPPSPIAQPSTAATTTTAAPTDASLAPANGDGRLFATPPSQPNNTSKTMGIERVFEKVIGKAALAALKSSFSTKAVVLIAGDQLTGKSTAAKAVAASLGGRITRTPPCALATRSTSGTSPTRRDGTTSGRGTHGRTTRRPAHRRSRPCVPAGPWSRHR